MRGNNVMVSTLEPTALLESRPRLSRRDFFVRTAGGFALGFLLTEFSRIEQVEAATVGTPVATWLTIGSDNRIVLTIGASEMGQGSASGLAQVLAEELMVDFSRIAIVQGSPSTVSPAPVGASINTVGSGMIRNNFWRMRDAGAATREMFVLAAMDLTTDGDRSHYQIVNGVVLWSGGGSFTYGQLADRAALKAAPANPPLVPDSAFRLIGKTVPRSDIPSKVDGSAKYGLDIRLDKMVYAVVKHAPALGGTLASTPSKPSNMLAVVPLTVVAGSGTARGLEAAGNVNAVAVVGSNTWDTWQAARRLSVKWNPPPKAALLNNAQFNADGTALLQSATPYVAGGANPPGTLYTTEGDAALTKTAIDGAAKVIDTVYTLPYVAHACMEVLNCTVDYVPNVKCEVWAPTQVAKTVLSLVMGLTRLPASAVIVHTTYLGGGLGRKAEADFVSQAVQVAMAVQCPVKLMWPREEDFTHDQYRPMAVVRARAGINASGNVVGWAYRNVSPSILGQRGVVLGPTGDSQGIEGAKGLPYNFVQRVSEYVTHPSPIPVGFWRSVGASINTFVVESMIDDLAVAAKQDPYQYRLALLTDPRWKEVLTQAAMLGGWFAPPPTGSARGIAIGTAFGSIVAQVVEISNVTVTSLRVARVSMAIDCYLAVNPGQIEAQMVGGMVHGLNATLYGKQTFVNGVAQAKNFNQSRMIRLGEMPSVKVKVIDNPVAADRTVTIGGAGELGVPTFAPALANAYLKLTGKRVTSLPLFPAATMGGL